MRINLPFWLTWESRRTLIQSMPLPINKVMIVHREIVITGSFNFTRAAEESNPENVLIIRSQELAREYFENWEKHKGQSEGYIGK